MTNKNKVFNKLQLMIHRIKMISKINKTLFANKNPWKMILTYSALRDINILKND